MINLMALAALLELVGGFQLWAIASENKIRFSVVFAVPAIVIGSYFQLPGVAESISNEFNHSGVDPKVLKKHNLYLMIECIVAGVVLLVCMFIQNT